MDPFEDTEVSRVADNFQPIRFTQLLREKARNARGLDSASQIKLIRKRNLDIKRSFDLVKLGVVIETTSYEPEATLVRKMRLSSDNLGKQLHGRLLKSATLLPTPAKLAKDFVLGRILKFCLAREDLIVLDPKLCLEKDFFNFKSDLDTLNTHKEQVARADLLLLCRSIHANAQKILESPQEKDLMETLGFTYSDTTFDHLFVTSWAGGHRVLSKDQVSSSEEEAADAEKFKAVLQAKRVEKSSFDEEPEKVAPSTVLVQEIPEPMEERQPEIDLSQIEPSKVNWFKYIIDRFAQPDEDGKSFLYNSQDAYANLLNIVISLKKNEEIQDELLDLVGFHNFELLSQLLEKREFIKDYCKILEEKLQKEKQIENYKPKNFEMGGSKLGISVEHQAPRKKGEKRQAQNLANHTKKQISNYDLLGKLGFNKSLIAENKLLGLKERTMTNLNQYVSQHQRDQQDENVVIEYTKEQQAQIYENQQKAGKSTVHTEDNDDWGYVSIEPPPKPPISKANLIKVSSLPLFAQKAFASTQHLNQIQSIVYPVAFKESRNLLVAAPTGSGKTNIALLTILREVGQIISSSGKPDATEWNMKDKQFKIIYIAPLKALAAEIVDKFSSALSYLKLKVRELTGDMSLTKQEIQESHILVCTPEKWDVVTRKTDGMMGLVNCMIIDEIHLLNDERGLVLECLVARAIQTGLKNQKPIRLVGLSATLPNYGDVASFIQCDEKGTFMFDSSFRPTPLKCCFYGIKEFGNAQRANNIMNEIIFENLMRILRMGKQCIIFVHQRAATYNTAMELIEIIKSRSNIAHLFDCQDAWKAERDVNSSRNEQVKELFKYGMGVHHAGMLRKDRTMVENLFHNGQIKILCSTSTLAWGVNLPAYAVLIKGTKVYDSSAGAYKDVGVFDVQQIFGRAGRPQYDTNGEAIILTLFKQMDDYVKMMQNKQTVESHLDKGLDNCINAEIAAGTICTISEGIQWLKKSFFYQRLCKNPTAYGCKLSDLQMDPTGHMILLEKMQTTVERLNRARLIRYNRSTEAVFSTDMGRIASNYYINSETMNMLLANLKPETREEMMLFHLANATEFKQLDARREEFEELKTLVVSCSIVEVDKAAFNEAHTKVLCLLECYLRNRQIKTFSLISDMAYVVQNCSRLLRAMFEIALQKNYALLAKSTLRWVQYLDKRLLPGAHLMRQFSQASFVGKLTNQNQQVTRYGYLRDDTIYRLEQFNISMDQLYEDDLQEAAKFIHPTAREELKKFLGHVPYIDIDFNCQPITRSILKLQLTLHAEFNWNDRWNGHQEPFWIIIENDTEILHQEFFQLQKKDVKRPGAGSTTGIKNQDTIQLTFFIPYQVPAGMERIPVGSSYRLEIVSDRWYDLEFFKNIDLEHLSVPDEDYPNTKLLPLRPIGVAALRDSAFETLYKNKFQFFNPIQTQVFHTLFHTDSNVLIGAPTGSGKTIMAELAMLRVFKETPKKKIIYIAPLKALAKERIIDWKMRLGSREMKKSVLELTGDCTPDLLALKDADLLITTPEKWDGISRNWQHRSYVSDVALVVIDEIHLLGQDRGPVIEVIVSRMRYISEQTGSSVRFVGLSTALANARDVADWLGIHKLGLFNFKPSVRPVPIKVFFEGFAEKHYCPRMATMNRPAFKAIMTHSKNNPVLVFVSSRRQTRLTALDLIALSAADQQEKLAYDDNNVFADFTKPFLHMNAEEISALSEYIKDENLRHTIQFGVGMHHAGLEESDRKIVEDLFVKKKIQILVTTSTLAWGVNFPARLVVVKGTEFFDPKVKRYVDFPLTDLLQMIGRAGRPGFDDSGIACVMVHEEKKNFYKKFLYEPFPVESSLANQLTDHLNAEIASGTLSKRQHCIDYLTWTYFFRRLTKNPAFYNLVENTAEAINNYLKTLVAANLDKLQAAGCVEVDNNDDVIRPTHLGYLASFYYLKHETVEGLAKAINETTGIDKLIEILATAKEFAGLPVRHNEDVLNEALMHLVPLPVPKHDLENPHVKANLLLQAHFERCPLPITDFITDTKSVLDQSIRVLQGMIDISADKGYLQTTINMVHLLQMLVQGQWLGQSPFLNVPHFSGATIKALTSNGIDHLCQLISIRDLPAFFKKAQIHFSPDQMHDIVKAVEKVPKVQVQWSIVKVNELNEPLPDEALEEGGEAQFLIDLRRDNSASSQSVGFSNFPKPKEASWFLIVANSTTQEVMALKRVAFKRATQKSLIISLPEDFHYEGRLEVFVLCDSYVGLDQFYKIDLNKVNDHINKSAATNNAAKNKPAKFAKTKEDSVPQQWVDSSIKDANVRLDEPETGSSVFTSFFDFHKDSEKTVNPLLVAVDNTDGNEEEEGDSDFEFDVHPDDIYDLTVF